MFILFYAPEYVFNLSLLIKINGSTEETPQAWKGVNLEEVGILTLLIIRKTGYYFLDSKKHRNIMPECLLTTFDCRTRQQERFPFGF